MPARAVQAQVCRWRPVEAGGGGARGGARGGANSGEQADRVQPERADATAQRMPWALAWRHRAAVLFPPSPPPPSFSARLDPPPSLTSPSPLTIHPRHPVRFFSSSSSSTSPARLASRRRLFRSLVPSSPPPASVSRPRSTPRPRYRRPAAVNPDKEKIARHGNRRLGRLLPRTPSPSPSNHRAALRLGRIRLVDPHTLFLRVRPGLGSRSRCCQSIQVRPALATCPRAATVSRAPRLRRQLRCSHRGAPAVWNLSTNILQIILVATKGYRALVPFLILRLRRISPPSTPTPTRRRSPTSQQTCRLLRISCRPMATILSILWTS